MKFTATEKKHLLRALETAIEWDSSLAASHYTAFPKRFRGNEPMVVPPEYKGVVAQCRRRIVTYRKLIARLRAPSTSVEAKR